MKKYELSISPDYVSDWGIVEAVRELFQNAIDQETVSHDNKMFITYDKDTNTLKIGNKNSILDIQSLLLGTSTKRDDNSTIGKFGEGYKIASLVLIRSGKTITFYNYGKKEVWKPRFVKSRRYDGANILTFFIDKSYFWQSVPDNNLTIEINNITEEEYQDIVNSNLHLQSISEAIDTSYGRILKQENLRGNIYVNGLYICASDFDHGYDIKPQHVKIDRDRKLIADFDLKWIASCMWNEASNKDKNVTNSIMTSLKCGSKDTAFVASVSSKSLRDEAYNDFISVYGKDAVPISTNDDKEKYKYCNTVIVNDKYREMIVSSSKYVEPTVSEDTIYTKLMTWIVSVQHKISANDFQKFSEIIKELE